MLMSILSHNLIYISLQCVGWTLVLILGTENCFKIINIMSKNNWGVWNILRTTISNCYFFYIF